MSADNGWVIRPDGEGMFVLQHYFASDDEWPKIKPDAPHFDTVARALDHWYSLEDTWSEYGLTIIRD